jgi:hypothetical protein
MAAKCRRGWNLDLTTIPHDMLELIFLYVDKKDVINVASLDTKYRLHFKPYIFSHTKMTWFDLLEEIEKSKLTLEKNELSLEKSLTGTRDLLEKGGYSQEDGFLEKYKYCIKRIRIIDSYSYGEWQIDFLKYLENFPYLTQLVVNSGNSSNWLKYRSNNCIRHLSLYFDPDHCETQNKFLSINPKNIIQLIRATNQPRIFNLNNVKSFSRLSHLELNSYHFNWEPSELATIHLILLSLTNCTWEYPFSLSQFNTNNTLQALIIKFSSNNAFILSERFNKFLNNVDTENLSSIQTLVINFDAVPSTTSPIPSLETVILSWDKYLSLGVLTRFLNRNRYPNLNNLCLYGWLLKLQNLSEYFKNIDANHLHVLDLRVMTDSNSGDFSQRKLILEDIKHEAKRQFPNLKFKVCVI